MFHIPNEGKRTNGDILKAAGMKSGIPDICLPVAKHNYHGLYIKLKYDKNKPSDTQFEIMAALKEQGYKVAVCYGFEEAKKEIIIYLQDEEKPPLETCLNAPWINGKCEGIALYGGLFTKEYCRKCTQHNPTKAERTLEENLKGVSEEFKKPLIKMITDLSEGKPLIHTSKKETLEVINKNLTLLVKGGYITINQSATVLSLAMDIYEKHKIKEERANEKNR